MAQVTMPLHDAPPRRGSCAPLPTWMRLWVSTLAHLLYGDITSGLLCPDLGCGFASLAAHRLWSLGLTCLRHLRLRSKSKVMLDGALGGHSDLYAPLRFWRCIEVSPDKVASRSPLRSRLLHHQVDLL
ncbi:hypothetical protein CRG98_009992 [Punica granatum]|nr:hypothetical protein CRG98_009992 [Punica granatum]